MFLSLVLTIASVALTPAGTVAFPRGHTLGAGERIRLVSLVSQRDESLFVRDVTALDAKPRMPVGAAIALLVDAKNRVLAASRPIAIHAGQETTVWPEADRSASTVVAWLKKPRPRNEVGLSAVDGGEPRVPSVIVDAADAVFAVWYGLEERSVRVLIHSDKLRMEHDTFPLARGSVTLIDEPLVLRPSLTISIAALPPDAARVSTPMTLTVSEASREDVVVRRIDVVPGTTYTLESLPAAPLSVDLSIGGFLLQERADLTSGHDMRLEIVPKPLSISGTVYFGEVPARATVRFQQKGKPLTVETDDRGAYQVVLWQPQRYVLEVVLADRPAVPAFSEMHSIAGSETIDVHVPSSILRVHVFDATTHEPLKRGEIVAHNRSQDGSVVTTSPVVDGWGDLPPQREGTTEIRVRAIGYASVDPIAVTVDDRTRDRVIEVPMTRGSETSELSIRLDTVMPAAAAEVASFSGEQLSWLGTADSAGRIAIPDDITRSRIIIRHPSAATAVVLFGSVAGPETLSLARPAPPLFVRVVHKDGTAIGPAAARLSLWLTGGVRLSGAEAAFATWSLGATAPDGTVILKGLQERPLRVFATQHVSFAQIATGSYDGLATTIPYPWPSTAIVPVADE